MYNQDFVIQDVEFGTFYHYFDDFEFGGQQTSNDPLEADGFDEYYKAEQAVSEIGGRVVIRRRITQVEIV